MINVSEISEKKSKFLLQIEDYSEKLYEECKNQKLGEKTKHNFDAISKPTVGRKNLPVEKEVNSNKEHLKLVRTVDVAREREHDFKKLL